jgi:hypothetical protein
MDPSWCGDQKLWEIWDQDASVWSSFIISEQLRALSLSQISTYSLWIPEILGSISFHNSDQSNLIIFYMSWIAFWLHNPLNQPHTHPNCLNLATPIAKPPMFATDLQFGYRRDISPYLLPGLWSFYCTGLGSEFLSNSIPIHFTWLKQGVILQPIHLRCTVYVHRMICPIKNWQKKHKILARTLL